MLNTHGRPLDNDSPLYLTELLRYSVEMGEPSALNPEHERQRLSDLASAIRGVSSSSESWKDVEAVSQTIANALRVRGGSGKTCSF